MDLVLETSLVQLMHEQDWEEDVEVSQSLGKKTVILGWNLMILYDDVVMVRKQSFPFMKSHSRKVEEKLKILKVLYFYPL